MTLADFLKCAICRGLPCRPVLQSCGHLFCAQCLSSAGVKQRCPACGVATEPIAPYANTFLQRIIEAYSSAQGNALYTDSISQSFSSSCGAEVHAKQNFAADVDESFICSSSTSYQRETQTSPGETHEKRRYRAASYTADGLVSADLDARSTEPTQGQNDLVQNSQNWAFYAAKAASFAPHQQSSSAAPASVFEQENVQPVTYFGRYVYGIPQEAVRQLLISYGLHCRDILRHGLASQRRLLFFMLKLSKSDESCTDERERVRDLLRQPFWRRKSEFTIY